MSEQEKIYESGSKLGKWILSKKLGEGGDGEVWEASSDKVICAIKILKNNEPDKLLTFKEEINIINSCNNINGITKIIDFDTSEFPIWFTMPIAKNSFEFIQEQSIFKKIRLISNIANTLIALHKKNITHRDIKPSNILLFDNNLILNDLGLGHQPYRDVEITVFDKQRGMGGIATMAPEMRRYGKDYSVNDYKPADVYALAKTLWIYITANKLGFDGEYGVNSIFSLKNYLKHELHHLLPSIDNLLIKSTKEDPLQRPSIEEFHEELLNILENLDNFKITNHIHWETMIKEIFPMSIPHYAKWDSIECICRILKNLIKVNHCVLYKNSNENNFSEIKINGSKIKFFNKNKSFLVIREPILTFNWFKNDPNKSYFKLTCHYKENKEFKTGVFIFFSQSSLNENLKNEFLEI